MMPLLIGVLASLAGSAVLLLGLSGALRLPKGGPIALWARARDAQEIGDRWVIRVDGVPVSVALSRLGARIEARQVLGVGPKFSFAAPRLQPGQRLFPDELLGLLPRGVRSKDDARDCIQRVREAIERHVTDPIQPPTITSNGKTVVVRTIASVPQLDVATKLAAAIASYDLRTLTPLSEALGAPIELSSEGLASIVIPRRVPITIHFGSELETVGTIETALFGVLETGSADLVRERLDVMRSVDASAVLITARPDAVSALHALVELRDARVIVEPRSVRVRFPGFPPVDRVRRALEAMEVLLSPGSESPFR